ncbi:MAG: hypothetical protein FIB07_17000 [Candidatus Methanoperedens sp.]|nr:hypothetical protein [Candidatus Methanoperedens sp.]
MNKKIPIILIISLIMLPSTALAAPIDDILHTLNQVVDKVKSSAQSMSLPGVGSITVTCDQGATCGQSGENWLVTMNSMDTTQTIDLKLPEGTKSITGDIEVTTQGTVTIEVRSKAPIQTIPVIYNSNYRYTVRDGSLETMNTYSASVYDRSQMSSVISTNYDIQLLSATGNSAVMSRSYDYRNPQPIYLYDGARNMATITPSHQTSGGFVTDTASVVFVDNGYGSTEAFDKVEFQRYLDKVTSEDVQYIYPWQFSSAPNNWAEFLSKMKSKGLNQFQQTDMPITRSGSNVILTYPIGSIGTKLQAVIPKAMALSITVRQHWGQPRIDSATLSPERISLGQGQQTLTVKVTNLGSSDVIGVGVIVNGDQVQSVVNSLTLAKDQQGTYTFYLQPTMTIADGSSANAVISIIATAGGSGLQDKTTLTQIVQGKPRTDCGWFGNCPTTTQKVSVTAYNVDGKSTLSNAPIFKNGVQIGNGHAEVDLPYGEYAFTTNNNSNPTLYAPSEVKVTLSGGETKVVSLYFTTEPQGETVDLTWIIELLVGGIVLFWAWKSGLLRQIFSSPAGILTAALVLVVLYILYEIYMAITGVAAGVSSALAWRPW